MLKAAHMVRLSASLIKIAYDSRHRGAATSQQHSIVVTSCGCIIKNCCPMQWESWAEIPEETKILVRDKLLVNFDFKDISPEVITYLDETFAKPKKSIAGKIARESRTLLHHSGSKPFSYRLEARREEGSKFPEIDLFKDVYASMVEKCVVVLQEATSQLPPDSPIEDVTVPEDAGFEIMTEKFGRRHGKVVRGIGNACVRETGASSSRSTIGEVNALKEEVTTLKGQLVAQDEQIKAQNEQMRVQNEQLRAENESMKAQMPSPDIAPPSTSQPLRPADT
ncbi:unnamed protein product [Malus baccata var. baccata]